MKNLKKLGDCLIVLLTYCLAQARTGISNRHQQGRDERPRESETRECGRGVQVTPSLCSTLAQKDVHSSSFHTAENHIPRTRGDARPYLFRAIPFFRGNPCYDSKRTPELAPAISHSSLVTSHCLIPLSLFSFFSLVQKIINPFVKFAKFVDRKINIFFVFSCLRAKHICVYLTRSLPVAEWLCPSHSPFGLHSVQAISRLPRRSVVPTTLARDARRPLLFLHRYFYDTFTSSQNH